MEYTDRLIQGEEVRLIKDSDAIHPIEFDEIVIAMQEIIDEDLEQ